MPLAMIETGHYKVDLGPAPIKQSWIIEGTPEARSRLLSASACKTSKTVVWSCTEGKFNWYYDRDETILILEGSIVLESEGMPPKRYGVGDVITFREGAHAKWHVEGYVRKLAFLHVNSPFPIAVAIRVIRKLRSLIARNAPGGQQDRPSAMPTD
ncbi:cupin domain-containing protein [Bradyrhizobium sp. CCGUVB1N3]|uniref:cupin domain-containing protein n=1 Tax=Bradyrhizobium sp. CCGUVB1N3 TaxID=2949629 RepID=UPI0020B423A5|nr:cupin domain-containing protein [Bradyrhizobium sp. CCGUVB1N3]MCP3471606.1 cupin domain-containing protein [Bradyrhizobium sp. CCGUVB1N3]